MRLLKPNSILHHSTNWILALILSINSVYAQNNEEYIYPIQNKRVILNQSILDEAKLESFVHNYFNTQGITSLQIKLVDTKKSIASQHYIFQVYYMDKVLDQAMVKLHANDNYLTLLQHNLPSFEEWHTLDEVNIGTSNFDVYLIIQEQLIPAKKELLIREKEDYYAHVFTLPNGEKYENILKYHTDSVAYGKVFNPDPLSSSGQTYGGNYQDAYVIDTAGLLIQNINNPGGNTVTAPSSNFTFDGQTFNIPTESYVNTFSGPVLRQVFENITLDGQGTVLGFNTAITDNLASYTTQIIREDYNYPELANEQVWRSFPVDFSGGTFNLTNDFFIISEFSSPFTNPAVSVNDSFDFTRNQVQFEDVNAFFHLNNYKSYWESLGFTDLASELILIDAHGNNGADNSFFSPTNPPRLVFGQGGVDDAEDADVIIHEYGHALSNFASPNSNIGTQRRSLDEGFGDYLAYSYSRALFPFNAFNVFSWDGHNEFWNGRVANSPKTALDISNTESIYFNGEVWSATLRDLHSALGRTITDQLAIELMYYNMPNGSLTQAALNLFEADSALYNGIHSCDIFQVLFGRKFLLGTCTDFEAGISNKFTNNNLVQLNNSYGFANNGESLFITSDELNIENSILQVIDINGKLIYEDLLDKNNYELKSSPFSSGLYFLTLQTKEHHNRFKILKN